MIKYVSYMLDSLSSDFEEEDQLSYYLNKVIYDTGDIDRDNYVLEVSPMLYKIMQRNRITYDIKRYMGILVSINENLVSNQIRIKYERNDNMNFSFSTLGFGCYKKEENKLPDKVLINKKKKATTLLFDDEAVVVKKNKDDKEDYEKAFLWGYFIKKSGLSKTQASKYIEKIMEENNGKGK